VRGELAQVSSADEASGSHGATAWFQVGTSSAKWKFLSIEPLLEDLGNLNLRGFHWVIVGGESGPRSRPIHPEWVLSLGDQCKAAGVHFFFKQWGGKRAKQNGSELDGVHYKEYPTCAGWQARDRRLATFGSYFERRTSSLTRTHALAVSWLWCAGSPDSHWSC
jgi:hypothetical protein